MCPCCGRSILVDAKERGKQRSLWNEVLAAHADEHGGDVWLLKVLGRLPGSKIPHLEHADAPEATVKKVLDELVRRCKAFLERVEG